MYSSDSCFFSLSDYFLCIYDIYIYIYIYIRRRDFIHSEIQSVVQRKIAECSKKALFCGDCCDRNRAIILVVFSLISL